MMILGNLKTIVAAGVALAMGLFFGHIEGRLAGKAVGFANCQAQNQKATVTANRYVAEEIGKLAVLEDAESESADRAEEVLHAIVINECRALTNDERHALAVIGGNTQ